MIPSTRLGWGEEGEGEGDEGGGERGKGAHSTTS